MDSTAKFLSCMFIFFILMGIVGFFLLNGIQKPHHAYAESTATIDIRDTFDDGFLDPHLWEITREGDVQESTIDVVDVNSSGGTDYRLRLHMNTLGTRDDIVKFLGVRSIRMVNFSNEKYISFDFDWNNQSNGCYLTSSAYLCPTATKTNPENEKEWLKFEYIGVPPGYNSRCVIASKSDGLTHYLYTEGWPEQRSGRKIGNQHICFILDDASLIITENGEEIYSTQAHNLKFTSAYLYLQMGSHSNYPDREIYFDNILVSG
jgi:hypothetical protein